MGEPVCPTSCLSPEREPRPAGNAGARAQRTVRCAQGNPRLCHGGRCPRRWCRKGRIHTHHLQDAPFPRGGIGQLLAYGNSRCGVEGGRVLTQPYCHVGIAHRQTYRRTPALHQYPSELQLRSRETGTDKGAEAAYQDSQRHLWPRPAPSADRRFQHAGHRGQLQLCAQLENQDEGHLGNHLRPLALAYWQEHSPRPHRLHLCHDKRQGRYGEMG